MVILGVDPGLRHTGFCIVGEGNRVVARGVLVPPGRGRIQPEKVIDYVLPALCRLIDEHHPHCAVVEQVTWYGARRRITLPLSHVAGAIAGFCLGIGIPVYLLLANMKRGGKAPRGKSWTEHERDAYMLASVVKRHLAAAAAGDRSTLPERSAVARRRITAPKSAHGTN